MHGLSVVTVCMNRREYLLRSAAMVWVGTGGEGRYGQFLMARECFAAIGVIEHSDEQRMGQARAAAGQALRRSLGLATMRSSRLGRRDVRWWHRLSRQSGRRLLQLPVWLLSLPRGQLKALGVGPRPSGGR